jgi:hypothetical protein
VKPGRRVKAGDSGDIVLDALAVVPDYALEILGLVAGHFDVDLVCGST